MKYYLITPEQYELHKHDTNQIASWSIPKSECIIECEDDCDITEYLMVFNNSNECNDWMYDQSSEEWRNWMTEEDYFGL
jgi:hypothetical protein